MIIVMRKDDKICRTVRLFYLAGCQRPCNEAWPVIREGFIWIYVLFGDTIFFDLSVYCNGGVGNRIVCLDL